jgi:hypothetical protein
MVSILSQRILIFLKVAEIFSEIFKETHLDWGLVLAGLRAVLAVLRTAAGLDAALRKLVVRTRELDSQQQVGCCLTINLTKNIQFVLKRVFFWQRKSRWRLFISQKHMNGMHSDAGQMQSKQMTETHYWAGKA